MELFAGMEPLTVGTGVLYQACDACKWWQHGHRRELSHCGGCGQGLRPAQGVEFGGLFVERKPGAGFTLHDGCDGSVRLDEADVPDALRFMVAHWRYGTFGELGEPGWVRTGQGGESAELKRFRYFRQ